MFFRHDPEITSTIKSEMGVEDIKQEKATRTIVE